MQDRQLLPIRYIDNDIEFQGGNHRLDWPRIWELVTTRQITDTKVGLDESLPVVVCERACDSLSSPPVKSGVKQVKIINQFLYISNCNWLELCSDPFLWLVQVNLHMHTGDQFVLKLAWRGKSTAAATQNCRPKEINFVFSTPNKFRPWAYHALCPYEFFASTSEAN